MLAIIRNVYYFTDIKVEIKKKGRILSNPPNIMCPANGTLRNGLPCYDNTRKCP